MKVLVTGANGFVGKHLIQTLLQASHEVVGTHSLDTEVPAEWAARVRTVPLDLCSADSVRSAVEVEPDGIIHLAAMAYSRDANANPGLAWNVNAGGTARLLAAVREARERTGTDPLIIVASSAEVYGDAGEGPRPESETPRPLNVYGATKVGTELAAAQALVEWGLRLIVVRPFPAAGPGYQDNRILSRWIGAMRAGNEEIPGDPTVVRDFVDVRDVALAYEALLARGRAGETYNIATGKPVTFGDLFGMIASKLRKRARLVPSANPRRDAPHLVGSPDKIRQHTGWQATIPLDRTLSDLIDAQTH